MSPSTRKHRREAREQASVQALPWLSPLLALACVVGFGAQWTAERSSDPRSQLESAGEYLLEHPYLVAPALLEQHVGMARLDLAREEFEARQSLLGSIAVPAGIARRHQEELTRRVERARASLEALPSQHLGLAAGSLGLAADSTSASAWLAHPFIHSGVVHLLGVLALLSLLGLALEASLGTLVVGLVALLSGAGAGLAFVHFGVGELRFIGLTGVVAGLFGAFLARRTSLREGTRSGPVFAASLLLLLLPAAMGFDLAAVSAGSASLSPGTWIASNWALLGGFGSGWLTALALRGLGLEDALSPDGQGRKRSRALARALAHADKGRSDKAYQDLVAILRDHPDENEAALALWKVALPLGRTEAAAPSLMRAIRNEVESGSLDAAVNHWLELVECELDDRADAGQLLRMSTLLRDAGEDRAALRALRGALDSAAGAAVASRVAREASLLDPRTAEEAAWRALGSLELDLAERQSLESLLADLQPKLGSQMSFGAARPSRPAAPQTGAAIEIDAKTRPLEVASAVPVGFDSEGIHVQVEGGGRKRVRFDRLDAVAVASVDGLGEQPVIIVDLVVNWETAGPEALRVIRMRSDRFDPRRLASGKPDPLDALRGLVKRLLHRSEATPLPDLQSASGMPFAAFTSLESYQRDVLIVETAEEA